MPRRPSGSISAISPVPPLRDRRYRWRIRAQVGGHRHDVVMTGTKAEAEARLDKLRRTVVPKHATTVGDLLARWLEHSDSRLSPTTMRTYRKIVEHHLRPLHETRLDKLRVEALDDVYAALSARGLTPATVRQAHAVMRRALVQARKWQLVERNVAEIASPPALGQREITPPSVAQVSALIAAADECSPAVGALVRLAAVLGARRAELVGLRWDELDEAAGTIAVRRSVVVLPGGVALKPTKTRQSRVAHLDADTLARLGALERSGPWIFGNGPLPWTPDMVSARWRRVRILAAAGDPTLTAVRLHDLRHWMVTQMLDAGVPVATVAARAGHADGNVTRAVYAHRSAAADAAAAVALAAALTPPSPPRATTPRTRQPRPQQ